MLQSKPYQLLLTDCIMPVLDGYDLTRRIRRRESREGGHLPIIALTANVLEGEEEKCRRAGMDDYVSKPLTLDRLAALLRSLFDREIGSRPLPAAVMPGPADGPIDWPALAAILGTDNQAELREVAGLFADHFDGLLDDLGRKLKGKDREALVRAAHSAKGAARNGAAPRLAALMSDIETGAQDGEGQAVQQSRLAAARAEFARLRDSLAGG
jgi:CheY-like chemotaxis protein